MQLTRPTYGRYFSHARDRPAQNVSLRTVAAAKQERRNERWSGVKEVRGRIDCDTDVLADRGTVLDGAAARKASQRTNAKPTN